MRATWLHWSHSLIFSLQNVVGLVVTKLFSPFWSYSCILIIMFYISLNILCNPDDEDKQCDKESIPICSGRCVNNHTVV